VMAFIEGRADQAKTVTLVDSHATQVLIRFPDLAPAKKERAAEAPPPREKEAEPEPPIAKAPPAPPQPPKEKAPPPPPPAAKGAISVETNPWTHVFEGPKKLGETPLIAYPLPAGKHKLRLVNDEKNIAKTVEVNVAPGKTTVTRLELGK